MTDAITAEMNEITRDAMLPWQPGDSVKAALLRAHRTLGISFRRARSFYYQEPVAILAHEADRLRAWHRQHIEREAARLQIRLAELQERQKALRELQNGLAMDRRHVSGSGGVSD